jgi:hypothetical protein
MPPSRPAPAQADILAAFLYIQTAERIQGSGIDHAKFNGYDLGPFIDPAVGEPGSGTIAKALTDWNDAAPACWSIAFPVGRRLVTYRADVLRFLPVDPATGKQKLDASFVVELPDVGSLAGDDDEFAREPKHLVGPRAVGASVVVVYRDRTQPLKGLVIYDGAYTKHAFQTMSQTLEGFYQSSAGSPVAREASLTQIVGDGRGFLSERVFLGGQLLAVNPFRSLLGPKWDNWRTAISLPPNSSSTTVTVAPHTLASDCLSWSAMILSTTVQDGDEDGLLDVWETSSTLRDPNGQALPNLQAMGADPARKDLFIELGYMGTNNALMYGFGDAARIRNPHTHLPSEAALRSMADAFARKGIQVHFDVGNNYQTPAPSFPYVIIPAAGGLARGGEVFDETITQCVRGANDHPAVCQFSDYPGTVGWKTGFRFLKEEAFDPVRKDMFRYAFFAHSVGIPKDSCQLTLPGGTMVSDPACDRKDASGRSVRPDFHVPRTNSGIGDFPGGDLLITLGAFDDAAGNPVGTDFMQASTLMHELGHTFELTHAGPPVMPREPNCKSNYLSVMNYLFQLRGLLDPAGVPQMDYSAEANPGIFEGALTDGGPLMALRYRTGWYAPRASSYLNNLAPAATKHCDGSELSAAEEADRVAGGGMVRVDSVSLAGFEIDWNADGVPNAAGVLRDGMQDVNFNGAVAPLNAGANDWDAVRLNELGGRRSVGGFFIDLQGRKAVGPLSLDVGRGDIGRGDIGRGDIGRGDIGRGDIGRGDIGRGDIGRGDIGRGDIGRGDIGRGDFGGGDLDVGAPGEPVGEIDLETFTAATGNAPTPPNALQACLTNGEGQCAAEGGALPVRLDWQTPNIGRAVSYEVYRFNRDPEAPFPPGVLPSEPLATIQGTEGPPPTAFLDYSAAAGVNYAYFVIAQFDDGQRSGISTFATVDTPGSVLLAPVQLYPIGRGDAIAQNDPATGCTLLPGPNATRGRGFRIAFDWADVESPAGISGYRIVATRVGAGLPVVDRFVEGSQFTLVSCNSFVEQGNLTGWEWRVQAEDSGGRVSEWSTAPFEFEQCILDDETPCRAPGPPEGSGGLVDPAGDAPAGEPDLISGSVLVQQEFVTLQVRFASGTFNRETTTVQFALDTDQNAGTGHQGTDSGCVGDNGVLGVEYIVNFGSTFYGTRASVHPFVGPACNVFGGAVQTAEGSVVYLANGFDAVFPRSFLNGDDGYLNFKVITSRYLGGYSFTGITDRMTDAGQPPGVVTPR